MFTRQSAVAIVILLCLIAASTTSLGLNSRIHLYNVKLLTFHKGRWTTSRRATAIPQLQCVSGPCHINIEEVTCRNTGHDDHGSVQWACNAELPLGISFSSIQVECEGYNRADDDFVLKGSCGLKYGLKGQFGQRAQRDRGALLNELHSPNRVFINDITSLTFRKGLMTTYRRVPPVEELRCTEGPCEAVDLSIVQCKANGFADDGEHLWKCDAELPVGVSFTNVHVDCEGFMDQNDQYILRGSCGLRYGLRRTGSGPLIRQPTTHYDYSHVLITDILSLKFRRGQLTRSQRGEETPQLLCTEGPCQLVREIECFNHRTENSRMLWECEADLPHGVEFSYMHVHCEGYSHPDDLYILRDSCALDFGLMSRDYDSSEIESSDGATYRAQFHIEQPLLAFVHYE